MLILSDYLILTDFDLKLVIFKDELAPHWEATNIKMLFTGEIFE